MVPIAWSACGSCCCVTSAAGAYAASSIRPLAAIAAADASRLDMLVYGASPVNLCIHVCDSKMCKSASGKGTQGGILDLEELQRSQLGVAPVLGSFWGSSCDGQRCNGGSSSTERRLRPRWWPTKSPSLSHRDTETFCAAGLPARDASATHQVQA